MTDWKPEKNISSPWDADVWENNIGQPVSDTYIKPIGTLHIGSKWYDVDTTKLTSVKYIAALFDAMGIRVSETNENFDKVKHLLIIPEEPKTLEQISQELDEKIDNLIENTKNKFYQSKYISEKLYNTKFDRIIQDFEYAKEHGQFPLKLTLGSGIEVNSYGYATSNFVIKPDTIGVGYWEIQPNVQMWLKQKPNWLVRKCAKIFFDFTWRDG